MVKKSLANRTRIEMPADEDSFVCWNKSKERFFIKFKCAGTWYHQWLSWSCREGKPRYYRALVALYKVLRRNGLVTDNLRYLAG